MLSAFEVFINKQAEFAGKFSNNTYIYNTKNNKAL